MAAATTLVLKNAADVNVNYYPIRIINGSEMIYVDRTNAVLAAQSKASVFFSESTTTRKVTGKATYPVLNATTGLLSHTPLGSFEFKLPLISTLAERQEVRKRLVALVGSAEVTAAVDNGETAW